MKKTYKYIALAALALGFTACSQDDDFAPQQEDIVKIASANIATEVQTRVNTLDDGTAWEENDQILLVNNSRDDKNSGTYTYDGTAWSLTGGIVIYASGTDATNSFTAYYPASATFTLPADQSDEAKIKSADRMVATTSDDIAKGAAVALSFERQNAKITIVPEITDEYGSSATISELTIGGITPYHPTGATDYTAIIAPTEIFELDVTVKVEVGDSEQTLTARNNFEIEAGKQYTIALKVGKDVVNVSSVSVNPWTNNPLTDTEAKEVKVTVTTSDNTATLTIPELATDAMVQKAISNLSADITTVNIYGSLTETQQNAVATALAAKTVSIYLPEMKASELCDALANTENSFSVSCGCILENGTYLVYNADGLQAWHKAAEAIISTGTDDTNDDWYAEYTTGMPDLTLAADITLTGENNWTPLGYYDEVEGESKDVYYPYIGTIDGNGHTITGLNINSADKNYIAFVGILGPNSEVKNLTFKDATIVGGESVATVAADCAGNVTNCHVTGNSSVSGQNLVAGVIANNSGIISDCTNAAAVTVTVNDGWASGGVVGSNYNGIVMGCFNSGDITGGSDRSQICGGVVGGNYGSNLTSSLIIACGNTGNVVATVGNAGGILGSDAYRLPVYACWTKETTELESGTEVSGKDGVGADCNELDVLYACYSFADDSAVADAITAMNTAIENYNASAAEGKKCPYQWQAGTDGYPALVKTE